MNVQSVIGEIGAGYASDVPYSSKGYWRVGGLIKHLVTVTNFAQIQKIIGLGIPVNVLGNGSNMLVADEGVSGLSLSLDGEFKEWSLDETKSFLTVGAGMRNSILLRRVKKQGVGGLAALAGVPGTIGGAIRMNAGTVLGEIGSVVRTVEWIDRKTAEVHRVSRDDCGFTYRQAKGIPLDAIVTQVCFNVRPASKEEARDVRHHLTKRTDTQPLHLPSCGSVFTNPKDDYAGRLIEFVGLKGKQCGDAQISGKHANFIVNNGNARAMDVYTLMREAKTKVFDETGISLHPEVKPMGDWPEGLWPL